MTDHTVIRKVRRLPLKGEVLVTAGQRVGATDIVARALLPGNITALRAAEQLGANPDEVLRLLKKHEGDTVAKGEVLAETKGFFGLFGAKVLAPVDGTIEYISAVTGTVGVRELPVPLNLTAYLAGTVDEVMPEEGVAIVTEGALVQGIFGVGGEKHGALLTVSDGPDAPLDEARLTAECAGRVLLGGATVNVAQIRKAAELGALAIIVGAVSDAVLRAYLGYDIGVAITGQEEVPVTLILTEGFGQLPMADRTFALLNRLQGRDASINGATQIRAGVIRPEIIVPHTAEAAAKEPAEAESELRVGSRVRLIREPYFGQFATVTAMPPELHKIETEAMVRVAEIELDGQRVLVPRANVEIIKE